LLLIEIVARVARQVRGNPALVAWSLAHYQRRHGLNSASLASWLSLSPAQLASLALCRRPESGLPCFSSDVHSLAAISGCSDRHLTELLLEVEAEDERKTSAP
jgi:hypothetical protein